MMKVYQSFSLSLQPQWQHFVSLFYLAFNIFSASAWGAGHRRVESERRAGKEKSAPFSFVEEVRREGLHCWGFLLKMIIIFKKNKINWSPPRGFQRTKRVGSRYAAANFREWYPSRHWGWKTLSAATMWLKFDHPQAEANNKLLSSVQRKTGDCPSTPCRRVLF